MNICLYTETALPKIGGQEIVVDTLARELTELGHLVTVLTPRRRNRPILSRETPPYRVAHHPPFFSTRRFVSWYRSFLQYHSWRHPFDVLHCHGLYPTGYIASLCKDGLRNPQGSRGVPVVVTSHGGDVYEHNRRVQKPALKERHERAAREADQLIAISAFTRQGLRRLGGRPERIVDIPNGVYAETFARPVDRPAGLDARITPGKYLLFMGRLVKRKGVDVLLRAMKLLPPDTSAPRLVVCGDGSERATLEALSAELGLIDRVSFLGSVTGDLKTYLFQNCLATVVPTRIWEAFGLIVLESYAAGRPVIASDLVGMAQLIQPDRTGWLVEPDNPEALAHRLVLLASNPAIADQASHLCREFVRSYSWRSIAHRHAQLYRSLLPTPHHAASHLSVR